MERSQLFEPEAHKALLSQRHDPYTDTPTLPPLSSIHHASSTLPTPSSPGYLQSHSQEATLAHIASDIVPALNGQGTSSRYFGFVTGGVLPLAAWADNVVTRLDQNVQVHLPAQTVATEVESRALDMLATLLRLDGEEGPPSWQGQTFTTGATASNILGLACGREMVVRKRVAAAAGEGEACSIGELGLLGACAKAGIQQIQVLTSGGHSSLSKAASVVGLGRASVKQLGVSGDQPWRMDFDALERELKKEGTASIIAVSAGEVNTGYFAVCGREEWNKLRVLADQYSAWIHVDGAFGVYVRALDRTSEFAALHKQVEGIEMADSIAIDGHKLLNVPYDCGMFFTRSAATLQATFTNPNAAYLSASASSIPSPLNIGLENSRRFRALPAYAALYSEGREGLAGLYASMIRLTRRIARFVRASPSYELLPDEKGADMAGVSFIVLFRARDAKLNDELVAKINDTRQMYVSGTSWKGEKATRIAVSNWRVDVEKDGQVVEGILTAVAEGRTFDITQL